MAFPLNFSYSPPSSVRQLSPGKAALVLLGIGILGAGLTTFLGIPMLMNATASQSWPAVEGVIKISEFTTNRDRDDGGVTYGASIVYDYTVKGTVYSGSNVHFGQYSTSDPSYGRGLVNRYPVGEQINVYYDPNDPSISVLEPGAGWSSFMVVGIGALFTLLGFIGGFFQFKKYKRGEPFASQPASVSPTISN
ncbi:MAG: DUF3592 domain-containing protein [Candidatus Sungbacteria bacterium]|nr:DUF3592 domain-containing protein [Candidatus Sungbacteria bacterium]